MQSVEIKMKVPQEVLLHLHKPLEEIGEDIRRQAAIRYYKKRVLSLGKAADLAGISRFQFIDYLVYNDEPVFQYIDDELEEINRDAKKINKIIDE